MKNSYAGLYIPLICLLFFCCGREEGKFVALPADKTNIGFNNIIVQDDSINVFDFPNIFNGGGVGIGDFNNDGLEDLYFTGNLVRNKLYLNKGEMEFEDVTNIADADGGGVWGRGVAVVDINNDGRLDIYVCATAAVAPEKRKNLLYVNQGNDKKGICRFKNLAAEYGLADTTQSTMAGFFDFDNDGDLDVFIGVNHIIIDEYANVFRKRNLNSEHPSTCKLYRNDWSDSLQHAYYTDISKQAGVTIEGYTHAVNIADFNMDGWQDIMVANDYASNNVLYINNRNGTFTDRTMDYFKHTAYNSMGSDAVDINNDGLTDVIEVDMLPQDNFRKKMFQPPSSYQTYQNIEHFGFQYQYPRNMLHLNMGQMWGENDSLMHPVFADIGFYANIAETDWSWCPLVADFDLDGMKDIIFTNGFPRDITDRDFMSYRKEAKQLTSTKEMLESIPEVKIHNYAYRNTGNAKFEDVSYTWGLGAPGFSNGAACADLDNDGDLDMVINNINDPASIYENRLNGNKHLRVKITGPEKNINALGARVIIYQRDKTQYYENNPYRGYLSTQSTIVHAGVGAGEIIDSVMVIWPDKKRLRFTDVQPGQQLLAEYKNAVHENSIEVPVQNWFTNITRAAALDYVHDQRDFIDFNIQKLLPHKFTQYVPAIAAGDMNGDGLDDLVIGSSPGKNAMLFFQQSSGKFLSRPLQTILKNNDDRGLLLFDADADNDLDLYIASGGYNYQPGDSAYADQFFVNDGKGNFTVAHTAIPFNTTSKGCVRGGDYDKDGDIDLFIGGRVHPWEYPRPVNSFIYRNDSKPGSPVFTDVTATVATALQHAGLICDALFTDYDNDGWMDLVLAGEWMPLVFLHNEKGSFKNTTAVSGTAEQVGWWNSLTAGDFDSDGDMDYIAGNLGSNSFYKASNAMPVRISAKDFDDNGSYDAIPSVFLPATLEENSEWKEFPAFGRDDMVRQMVGTRAKFTNYKKFANAIIDSILPAAKLNEAITLSANFLQSAYIQNNGKGNFSIRPLPWQAQLAPIAGMVTGDFNNDGSLDCVVSGNDFSAEPIYGRYDAMNSVLLQGDGRGNFTAISNAQSGICIDGDAKGLVKLRSADSAYLLAATQNKGPLLLFRNKKTIRTLSASPGDLFVMMTMKNGSRQKYEFSTGSSFLSQNASFIELPPHVTQCEITDVRGKTRKLFF